MRINGPVLKALREAHGLSQMEMGQIAGISHVYVCQLETGVRPGSPAVARKLATALNVHVLAITVAREVVA